MEGEFESKLPEQLTTSNFSYINRDLVGTKQELVKYEALPKEIIFDTSARSYVYDFTLIYISDFFSSLGPGTREILTLCIKIFCFKPTFKVDGDDC